jgi:glycosyltransferase involved in cell wall biosynthesis
MSKRKILYIFTSGHFFSANNDQWVSSFYNENLNIAILLENPNQQIKDKFLDTYNNFFNIIYFEEKERFYKKHILKKILYLKQIAKAIDEFNPDLIHIHGLYYSYIATTVFFLKNNPKIVFNIWGNDFNTLYRNRLKNRILFNKLISKANLVWTNWMEMEDRVKKHFPKSIHKIRTIFWGIDCSFMEEPTMNIKNKIRKKFNINNEEYIIISPKGLSPVNNQLNIIKALKKINQNLNFKLILFAKGNEEYLNKIRSLIEKENLEKKIVLSYEFLSETELKALYSISDLCLSIPSKDQLTRVIFEAITSNNNLIISNLNPYLYLKFQIGFNLDTVDHTNIDILATRIQHYITNKPKANWDFEKSWIKRVFCFNNNKSHILNIYEDLINKQLN